MKVGNVRECPGETVKVFETHGNELHNLLRDVADLVEDHEGWSRVVVEPGADFDTGDFTYNVTVYLHD